MVYEVRYQQKLLCPLTFSKINTSQSSRGTRENMANKETEHEEEKNITVPYKLNLKLFRFKTITDRGRLLGQFNFRSTSMGYFGPSTVDCHA